MEWQPIETAPKDGTFVILFIPEYKHPAWIGYYHIHESFVNGELSYRHESWNVGMFGVENPEPTHWMQVPPRPKDHERKND